MARTILLVGLLATALGGSAVAADLSCTLRFEMQGWSAIYKKATGTGTVSCSDGAAMKVTLASKGLGLTAGKSSVDAGKGVFAGVKEISDVLGDYVSADAGAGAVKASSASALTKGEVSLALSGTGRGWDLGVSISDFSIQPYGKAAK
jgi:hypothetical protein